MSLRIRKIQKEDSPAVGKIIKTVMPEFGAGGKGFAIHDEEVADMFTAYTQSRSVYYVCEWEGRLIGGGGIGPLAGGDPGICELKKMYFLPEGRGKGWGQEVFLRCMAFAQTVGFEKCYLETFHTMEQAIRFYEKNGFIRIDGPLGSTGHFACDVFFTKEL